MSAETSQQLKDYLGKRKVPYEQFRSKTLVDLMQDQTDIVIANLSLDDKIKLAQKGLENPSMSLPMWAAQVELEDIDDDTFKELKASVTKQTPVLPNFTMYISQCDLLSAARLVISGNHEYLRAIPFNQP